MTNFDAVLRKARIDFEAVDGPRLIGVIWEDKKKRYEDGEMVRTSTLTGHDGPIFFTKNSRYFVSFAD